MKLRVPHARFCLLAAVLCTLSACDSAEPLVPVSGQVMFRGKPLTRGVVMFQPTSGPMARGKIRTDGTYELETLGAGLGTLPGTHKIRISSRAPVPEANSSEMGLGKLLIPSKYTHFATSGLVVEVTANQDKPYDFELIE